MRVGQKTPITVVAAIPQNASVLHSIRRFRDLVLSARLEEGTHLLSNGTAHHRWFTTQNKPAQGKKQKNKKKGPGKPSPAQ